MNRIATIVISFTAAIAMLAAGVFALGYGAQFVRDWQLSRQREAQAELAARIPEAVSRRSAEAAERCWLISQEAMRRFHALSDEQQVKLWIDGVGWGRFENEVAREWGWNLARECEPEKYDPVVAGYVNGKAD